VAAIVYGSLLVATYGLIGLILDREVITESDASVLLGPAMVLLVSAVVFVSVARSVPRSRSSHRLPVARSVVTAVAVYLIGPAVGGMLYATGRSEPFAAITFFFHYASSPFILSSAVVAFVVVLLAPLIDRPTVI
jgi:hypothetical protein